MTESDSDRAREYLLGRLAGEARSSVERAFLTEDASLQQLEAVELDLITDYLSGRLQGRDLTDFRVQYASPAQRQRIGEVAALRQSLRGGPSLWVAAGATAAVVILAVSISRLGPHPAVAVVDLVPGIQRQAASPPPVVALEGAARLRIPVEGSFRHPGCRAVVSDYNGDHLLNRPLSMVGGMALLSLEANALPPGEYVLRVSCPSGAGLSESLSRAHPFRVP